MLKNSSSDWYRNVGRVNQPRTHIAIGTANRGTSQGAFSVPIHPPSMRGRLETEPFKTGLHPPLGVAKTGTTSQDWSAFCARSGGVRAGDPGAECGRCLVEWGR